MRIETCGTCRMTTSATKDGNWRSFEPVYARMRPAPPVLDVGSGLGLFVECCQRHGTTAVGLELSKEAVEASGSADSPSSGAI